MKIYICGTDMFEDGFYIELVTVNEAEAMEWFNGKPEDVIDIEVGAYESGSAEKTVLVSR